MNRKLLRKVAKHILAEPKRLNMDFYGSAVETGPEAPRCGTVGCIAGWAALLSLDTIPDNPYERSRLMDSETARIALRLRGHQASRLFTEPWVVYGPRRQDGELGWPEKFAKAYLAADNPEKRAKITAQRIEHFIKTSGRE